MWLLRLLIVLLALTSPVLAQLMMTGVGPGSAGGGGPPPGTGSALLVDNTNPALLVDNTNPACLVGGC